MYISFTHSYTQTAEEAMQVTKSASQQLVFLEDTSTLTLGESAIELVPMQPLYLLSLYTFTVSHCAVGYGKNAYLHKCLKLYWHI